MLHIRVRNPNVPFLAALLNKQYTLDNCGVLSLKHVFLLFGIFFKTSAYSELNNLVFGSNFSVHSSTPYRKEVEKK